MTADASALVVHQPVVTDVDEIAEQLTAIFLLCRDAVAEGRAVVLVVDDRDLLGQGGVEAAALATGLLGLSRALALEGVRDAWSVNVVTVRGDDSRLDATCTWLTSTGLTGQLVRLGTDHLGKIWP